MNLSSANILNELLTQIFVRFRQSSNIFLSNSDQYVLDQIYQAQERLVLLDKGLPKHLVVAGIFNTGKSTFLNALLQTSIIPSRPTPATGLPTSIKFSQTDQASLIREDNYKSEISLQQIHDFILISESQNYDHIKAIQLRLKSPFLEEVHQDWLLIDTPGLNDNGQCSEITEAQLFNADLLVLLISALQPLNQTEKEFIATWNKRLNGNILIIVNQIDRLNTSEDRDMILAHICQCLKDENIGNKIIGHNKFFPLSAQKWLNSDPQCKLDNDFAAFKTYLQMLLCSRETRHSQFLKMPDRVSYISRLGILNHHIQSAETYFKQQKIQTEHLIEQLQQQAELDLQRREQEFSEHTQQIRTKLIEKENIINQLFIEQFRDCERLARNHITAPFDNYDWEWKHLLDKFLPLFHLADGINSHIQEITANLDCHPQIEFSFFCIRELYISKQVTTFVLATEPQSKWLFHKVWDPRPKWSQSFTVSLYDPLKNKYHSKLDEFMKSLYSLLDNYHKKYYPQFEKTQEQIEQERYRDELTRIFSWLHDLKPPLTNLLEIAMSLQDQFSEQWQTYIRLCTNSFHKKYYSMKKDRKNLTALASSVVTDHAQRWQGGNIYETAWLNRLQRDYPNVAEEVKDKINAISISTQLKNEAPVSIPEIIVLIFTLGFIAGVLLMGQNVNQNSSFRINWNQGVTVIGLGILGFSATKSLRDARHNNYIKNLENQVSTDLHQQGEEIAHLLRDLN